MSTNLNRTIIYRQEVLSQVFDYIQSTESFYLVGAASIGKTRLIDQLTLPDVREYFLSEEATRTWIVRVDLNRLVIKEDLIFSFFELILSSLLLESSKQTNEEFNPLKVELVSLFFSFFSSSSLFFFCANETTCRNTKIINSNILGFIASPKLYC